MGGIDPSLLDAPPPRDVPLGVRLRHALNTVTIIGLGFTAIVLMFALVFALVAGDPRLVLVDRALDAGAARAQGTVIAVERTSVEINEKDLVRVRFRFEAGGRPYEGASYTTERAVLSPLSEGGPVAVEHDPADPARSRAEGTLASPTPWWVFLIVAVLALPGVGLLAAGVAVGLRSSRLVTHGQVAWAKVERVWPWAGAQGGMGSAVVAYVFPGPLGGAQHGVATLAPPPSVGDTLKVVYLPERPSRSVPVSNLGSPSSVMDWPWGGQGDDGSGPSGPA